MPDHNNDPRPRCAVCGDFVGVYKPVWIEHHSGSLRRTSLLNLDVVEREAVPAIYHASCAAS